MKPSGPVARKRDYIVAAQAHAPVAALVRAWHYSGGSANTSAHAHALIKKSTASLVGGALWMPPTAGAAKGLAAMYLGSSEKHREVLSLSLVWW